MDRNVYKQKQKTMKSTENQRKAKSTVVKSQMTDCGTHLLAQWDLKEFRIKTRERKTDKGTLTHRKEKKSQKGGLKIQKKERQTDPRTVYVAEKYERVALNK